MRVNARLDDSYQSKIDFLSTTRRLSVSDVVRESIDRYYAVVQAEESLRRGKLDALVGMVQDGDLPTDLSARYKDYLQDDLRAKFPG